MIVLITMFFVIISIDSIELIKESAPHVITLKDLLTITITKLPFIVQETFIFVIFFSTIHTFFFLSKHNEYTALRTGGISIWQFLYPPMIIGILISILLITVLNPFSTVLLNYSEQLKARIKGERLNKSISLLGGEVWLFDKNQINNENYIINASSLQLANNKAKLTNPNFIFLDKNYKFLRILNARTAILNKNKWLLTDYTEYIPKKTPKLYTGETYIISNNLDLINLQNNFKSPRGISVWDLPYFITVLKATGYPTHKYYSYFYKLLIKPFLIPSIICFAASFTLKPSRHYNVGVLIAIGALTFIFLYCLTELALSVAFDNKILQIFNVIAITLALNIGGVMTVRYFENK
ncbi:MAG: LptF/LptG family permease [Rickettsiales bacterium]|nr:LptF/LptG family permease [Rickettsiales bacterium]